MRAHILFLIVAFVGSYADSASLPNGIAANDIPSRLAALEVTLTKVLEKNDELERRVSAVENENVELKSALEDLRYPDAENKHDDVFDSRYDDEVDSEYDDDVESEHNDTHDDEVESKHDDEVDSEHDDEVESKHDDEVDSEHDDEVDSEHDDEVESKHDDEVDSKYEEEVVSGYDDDVDSEHDDEVDSEHDDEVESKHDDEVDSKHDDEVDSEHDDEVESKHDDEVDSEHDDEVDSEHDDEVESKHDDEVDSKYEEEVVSGYDDDVDSEMEYDKQHPGIGLGNPSIVQAMGHRENKRQLSASTVAFTAVVAPTSIQVGQGQTVIYDQVVTNVGGAYDSTTGIFTAPVSGVYAFNFAEMIDPGSDKYLQLVKDGKHVMWNYGHAPGSTHLVSSSRTATIEVSQGGRVWVRTQNGSHHGTWQILGNGFTTFSGWIIEFTE